MKIRAIVLELLTVLCTETAISTGRALRVPGRLEGISGKRVQLVSADYEGTFKICLLPVFEVLSVSSRRAVEVVGETRGMTGVGAEF